MDVVHLLLVLLGGTGPVEIGFVPHYRLHLMRAVAERRDVVQTACMVASPRYSIGDWVWLYRIQTGKLLHCQVVDVSAPQDRRRHHRTRRVVELSYEVTCVICGSTLERADRCPVVAVGSARSTTVRGGLNVEKPQP
jgi:hypothetical protein